MLVVYLLYAYCLIGVLFAIWFSFFKVSKIDNGAAATSIWFKLIIMPASILLWPIVFKKAYKKG